MELSEELRLGLTYFAGEAVDCSDLMEEAADRIAAQAAEIERLRDKIDHIGVKHPQDLLTASYFHEWKPNRDKG